MWMLVVTACFVTGPGDADCITEHRGWYVRRADCASLHKPMHELVSKQAQEFGTKLIFVGTRCTIGVDS